MTSKEKAINDLVKKIRYQINEETNEGIFDPIKNRVAGLRGVWRGEGYDYFKYLSSLRSQIRTLRKLDKPNEKIFQNLSTLKLDIAKTKMPTDKKDKINKTIDLATSYFKSYQDALNAIETIITQKID